VIVEGTPVGRLGLTICYDLRFPELFQRLSEAGADVIGARSVHRTDREGALAGADASQGNRGGAFVVAAQAGHHEDGRDTFGHSLVADPWGELLLEMAGDPGLAFIEIDLDRIAEVRARIPVHQHRKSIGPVAN
jgi:predicted amidohydrolase